MAKHIYLHLGKTAKAKDAAFQKFDEVEFVVQGKKMLGEIRGGSGSTYKVYRRADGVTYTVQEKDITLKRHVAAKDATASQKISKIDAEIEKVSKDIAAWRKSHSNAVMPNNHPFAVNLEKLQEMRRKMIANPAKFDDAFNFETAPFYILRNDTEFPARLGWKRPNLTNGNFYVKGSTVFYQVQPGKFVPFFAKTGTPFAMSESNFRKQTRDADPEVSQKDGVGDIEINYTSEYLKRIDIAVHKRLGYTVVSDTRNSDGTYTVVYRKAAK